MANTCNELVTDGAIGTEAGPATHIAPDGGDRRRRGVRLYRDICQQLRPRLDRLLLGLHGRQVTAVHRLAIGRHTQKCGQSQELGLRGRLSTSSYWAPTYLDGLGLFIKELTPHDLESITDGAQLRLAVASVHGRDRRPLAGRLLSPLRRCLPC